MQIKINKSSKVTFNTIKIGELFYLGNIYMKIKEFENNGFGIYNAINLTDGEFNYFYPEEEVNKVNGELVVEII